MKKLAVITTHPIQYNAPWLKLLHERGQIEIHVFYTWPPSQAGAKYDPGFKKMIDWDIPLLEGYPHSFFHQSPDKQNSRWRKSPGKQPLHKQIEKWKPDALLVIGWRYQYHFSCMRYFKGKIPILFRGDSTLLDEKKGLKLFLRRTFLRWIYRYIDFALYTGTNNKHYFLAHGLQEKQLLPALHAIDIERFSQKNSEQQKHTEQLKIQAGIKPSDFVVLFAGKFEKKKNPFFLLDLAQKIKDPEIIFLFTGNGELEEELKNQSAHDSRIRFLGFQNQSLMPSVYSVGNVFVLPSKGPGETWGLAVNEAMACGLPVIVSSKVGGAVDLVNGKNGIIFHPGETEKVIAFIEDLKNHPGHFQNAKESARIHIQKFNFTQIAESIEKACHIG